MELCTGMEIMSGKMAANTRAIINSIRSMVKGHILTRTVASTEENGKKACSME